MEGHSGNTPASTVIHVGYGVNALGNGLSLPVQTVQPPGDTEVSYLVLRSVTSLARKKRRSARKPEWFGSRAGTAGTAFS
jgi:hypothetical protein